uniref:Uncharacterized protein n=1 Tax=Vespula pensylvanica TaxID=30213 RepID=A0A834UHN3_VESPE|nr:hypothetical protein H0235_001684 [Vespula pensylvanica]
MRDSAKGHAMRVKYLRQILLSQRGYRNESLSMKKINRSCYISLEQTTERLIEKAKGKDSKSVLIFGGPTFIFRNFISDLQQAVEEAVTDFLPLLYSIASFWRAADDKFVRAIQEWTIDHVLGTSRRWRNRKKLAIGQNANRDGGCTACPWLTDLRPDSTYSSQGMDEEYWDCHW